MENLDCPELIDNFEAKLTEAANANERGRRKAQDAATAHEGGKKKKRGGGDIQVNAIGLHSVVCCHAISSIFLHVGLHC